MKRTLFISREAATELIKDMKVSLSASLISYSGLHSGSIYSSLSIEERVRKYLF